MKIPQTPIFEGISREECAQMFTCFGVREEEFRPEETVYDFGAGKACIGILVSGSAIVERVDQKGDRTILEHLQPGGVFGEMLMFENVLGDSIAVLCERSCTVWFIPAYKLTDHSIIHSLFLQLLAGKPLLFCVTRRLLIACPFPHHRLSFIPAEPVITL